MNAIPVARRAIGAIFFILFGGLWLTFGCYTAFDDRLLPCGLVLVATLGLLTAAWRRTSRLFNLLNVAQWILIFVVANILNNVGLAVWIVPSIIGIVGLHFLPLSRLFANPPHYLTGLSLILWAGAGWALRLAWWPSPRRIDSRGAR